MYCILSPYQCKSLSDTFLMEVFVGLEVIHRKDHYKIIPNFLQISHELTYSEAYIGVVSTALYFLIIKDYCILQLLSLINVENVEPAIRSKLALIPFSAY